MLVKKETLLKKLKKVENQPILVIGDLMLDEFHWCEVERISPEAPVPICKILETTYVPGGAANVASNIKAIGGDPIMVGHIGRDSTADNFSKVMQKKGVRLKDLVIDSERPTILKSRIIARHQHVVRIDREAIVLGKSLEQKLIARINEVLPNSMGVVLSDYGKGTLSKHILERVLRDARNRNIPVIVDPKGDDFTKYKGATLITPNFHEFQIAVKKKVESESEIQKQGIALIKELDLESLVVTRSEKGMSVIIKGGIKHDIPTKAKEVSDITGAGDTVIAALALGISAGLSLEEAASFANFAAGIVVGKMGTATASLSEIIEAIKQDS